MSPVVDHAARSVLPAVVSSWRSDASAGAVQARRRLDAATAHLEPPFAVLDLTAMRANAADLRDRAAGRPIRVASKSVRVRAVLDDLLKGGAGGLGIAAGGAATAGGAVNGFAGVMTYALREALWLAGQGYDDILMGYPTADRTALRALATDPAATAAIVLMVDDVAQLDLIDAAVTTGDPVADAGRPAIRVCLDIDASLRIGRVHLGVRRSPLRTPVDVADLARVVHARPGFTLAGVMFYEAQIAGLPDSSPAVRWVKRRSCAELARRRSAVVDAVAQVTGTGPGLVNGGGTGSLHVTTRDGCVTELTAGSGLFGPTLFDGYRDFTPRPAAFFALPVVRRPAPGVATLFGGGYVASGPAGTSRLPRPVLPGGLKLIDAEGAGEVQTPVRGRAAATLQVGDRVWFRHAKAGEFCERFDVVHLVEGDRVVRSVPTYRGEGMNFG